MRCFIAGGTGNIVLNVGGSWLLCQNWDIQSLVVLVPC